MKRIQAVATTLASSCCIIYLLLQWEEIQTLFPAAFVVLMKQVVIITFFLTIAVNPNGVVNAAARLAPKLLDIASTLMSILITNKKKDDGA